MVAWGETCVFAQEDGDPLPFSINTACMPWVTPNVYPSSSAFYSPATACPTSWTAVATQTSGTDQWVDGETALSCCPDGYDSDGRNGCRPGANGVYPVVVCGEADADENELQTYTGGAWPATAIASISALRLRYQASDIGSGSATSGSSSATDSSRSGGNTTDSGLSTGATAAIATVIPLGIIIAALVAFLFWRRRKHRKTAAALASQNLVNDKAAHSPAGYNAAGSAYHPVPGDSKTAHLTPVAAASGPRTSHHETPEWNAELDASEAERQRLVSPTVAPPASATDGSVGASELGGLARVQRKPIAPVEMDGTPVRAEVGDAYIPYRLGREES